MTGDIVLHLSFFYLARLAELYFFCLNVPPTYTLVTSTCAQHQSQSKQQQRWHLP